MITKKLDLQGRLKRCTSFEREEEVKIILRGIKLKLPNPQDLKLIRNKFRFLGDDENYAIVDSEGNSLVKCYTGDYHGTRMLRAISSQNIVNAIEEIEKIIPRKLAIRYE